MLVECLIKRDGPTRVTVEKYDYVFKDDQPALTDGDKKAVVCIVNSSDHRDRLISSGFYRLYVPKAKAEVSHEDTGLVLTKETFNSIKNAPQLKSLIKKSTDKGLLQELLDNEAASDKPREWAGEALAARIKEL